MLLGIYAKCIDGQQNIAKRRIADALRDDGEAQADSTEAAPPGEDREHERDGSDESDG